MHVEQVDTVSRRPPFNRSSDKSNYLRQGISQLSTVLFSLMSDSTDIHSHSVS